MKHLFNKCLSCNYLGIYVKEEVGLNYLHASCKLFFFFLKLF